MVGTTMARRFIAPALIGALAATTLLVLPMTGDRAPRAEAALRQQVATDYTLLRRGPHSYVTGAAYRGWTFDVQGVPPRATAGGASTATSTPASGSTTELCREAHPQVTPVPAPTGHAGVVASDPRYDETRRELDRRLTALKTCSGTACRQHFGMPPAPALP